VKTGAVDNQAFKFNGTGVALADITVDPHTPVLIADTGCQRPSASGLGVIVRVPMVGSVTFATDRRGRVRLAGSTESAAVAEAVAPALSRATSWVETGLRKSVTAFHLLAASVANLFKSRRRLEAENLFLAAQHRLEATTATSSAAGQRSRAAGVDDPAVAEPALARVVQPATILR
jgi:hypothetical protein